MTTAKEPKKATKAPKTAKKAPTDQGDKPYKVGNKKPPKERQFGQPNGNPRNPGGWKKEDTARYMLEQMIHKTEAQLQAIIIDTDAPMFARNLAGSILGEGKSFKTAAEMINQVYGTPKQTIDHEVANPLPLIDLTGLEEAQDAGRALNEKPKKATKTTKKTAKTIKKCTKKAKTAETAPKIEKKARKTAKKATEAPQSDETEKDG